MLNVDNYSVHLDEKVAEEHANLYGIFVRCLLRNASHIQQPIDQHVGIFVKNNIKRKIESWIAECNTFNQLGSELKYDKQKWRSLIARFVSDAIQEIQQNQNKDVLTSSWCNYGLFLMTDGSEDGNITNLHRDSVWRPERWKNGRAQDLIDKVTIKTRAGATIFREHVALHVTYSMQEANSNSKPVIKPSKRVLRNHIQRDVQKKNILEVQEFHKKFQRDLTNVANELPVMDIVTPFHVMTLKTMYIKYGRADMMQDLFVNQLGLPWRDDNGALMRLPRESKVCDIMMDVEDVTRPHKTSLVIEILNEVKSIYI